MSTADIAENGWRGGTTGMAGVGVAPWPGQARHDLAPGQGTVHGDLSQLTERPLNGALYFGVLAVAAGIDIATFYQVLALVMSNVPDAVVWLGVVGFTVTALTLAHTIGVRMRDRRDDGGRAISSASAWLTFLIWLFVGVTAFIVRLVGAAPVSTGGTTIVEDGTPVTVGAGPTGANSPLLAALLFLALYFATGTVAGIAGYLRHNAAARAYRASMRSLRPAARDAARSVADLTLARATKVALDEERRRRIEAWEKTLEEWAAIARRLKQEARLRLAAAAQDPSTTDAYFIPPSGSGFSSPTTANGAAAPGSPRSSNGAGSNGAGNNGGAAGSNGAGAVSGQPVPTWGPAPTVPRSAGHRSNDGARLGWPA